MAEVILATQTTPAAPSAGNVGVYVDSADGFLKQIDSAGNVLKNMSGLPLGLTGATAATRYVGGTASGAPVAGTFAKGDFVIAQDATVQVCTVAGSPGTWVQAGGGGAGAMTQLFDSTLGADAATIDTGAGGIAGSANHLLVVILGRSAEAVLQSACALRVNNDSAANYDVATVNSVGGAAVGANSTAGQTSCTLNLPGDTIAASIAGAYQIIIPAYAQTTFHKTISTTAGWASSSTGDTRVDQRSWHWRNTAAITRLALTVTAGSNLRAGSRMTVYGLT